VYENISNSMFDAIYAKLLVHSKRVTDIGAAGENIWP
jgi:hypothetical protein